VHLFSFTTYPNEKQKEDRFDLFKEKQDWYFGTLYKNGQIFIEGCNTIFKDGNFTTYFLAPEMVSLKKEYSNKYVDDSYEELMNLCEVAPKVEIIGQSSDYECSCDCKMPSWYMLYSDYSTNESPVVCGDCGRTIPLYKMPKILGEYEYLSVLSWQKAYKAYDEAFMKGFGERFAYKQISNLTSDLSITGRNICTEFEKIVGKPFYYYLFKYRHNHKSKCPICQQDWKLSSGLKFIDYQCEKCRIVGDENK
jgi:predicted  nucleic acid-binding Zn ribbon protein